SGDDLSVVAVAGLSKAPFASLGRGLIRSSLVASPGLVGDHLAAPSPRFAGFSAIGTFSRSSDLRDEPTNAASHTRPAATRANPKINPIPAAYTFRRTNRFCPSGAVPCHADRLGPCSST